SEPAINNLFAMAAGDSSVGPNRLSRTDRTVRLVAAVAVLAVGLWSGPSVPLLLVGAATGASTLPRHTRPSK
ncbi:MAG: hypothetical protein RI637_01825, partial [Acidimicrobiia bacterium]|nr:hypothetical protein [Acidimicrobiia bacterium]